MAELIWTAPMRYYSRADEAAFSGWLHSIPGVTDVRGQGHELIIRLKSRRLSQTALREFIALYRRYNRKMSELEQFVSDTNRSWFQHPDADWHNAVFADSSS
jgi:hypothetical protein